VSNLAVPPWARIVRVASPYSARAASPIPRGLQTRIETGDLLFVDAHGPGTPFVLGAGSGGVQTRARAELPLSPRWLLARERVRHVPSHSPAATPLCLNPDVVGPQNLPFRERLGHPIAGGAGVLERVAKCGRGIDGGNTSLRAASTSASRPSISRFADS